MFLAIKFQKASNHNKVYILYYVLILSKRSCFYIKFLLNFDYKNITMNTRKSFPLVFGCEVKDGVKQSEGHSPYNVIYIVEKIIKSDRIGGSAGILVQSS
ncbi:hypothetical protein JOC93_003996 [Priestia taiwanensis]|uniref:Uncharacterized protein n=1 Tax=Priestia taiwanensis TaxID=1347902 RepID=A0A917AZJ4_9BACI|nr:hypothetical protein [Priestia taiwanensis]GGE86033.1 hypothetical protein GCM10007140_39280 [Priestia taiwanensis]